MKTCSHRFRFFGVLLLGLANCFCLAAGGAEDSPRERTEKLLDQAVDASFVDTPREDVCGYLSTQYGVAIVFVKHSNENVLRFHPCTCRLKKVSLRSLLNILFDGRTADYRINDSGQVVVFTPPPPERPQSKVQAAANEKIRQALERKEAAINCHEVSFDTFLKEVAVQLDADVSSEQHSLRTAATPRSISCSLPKMPVHRALTTVLFPYDLHAVVKDETVHVRPLAERVPTRKISDQLKQLAAKSIEIEFDNVPLTTALQQLEKTIGYPLAFDHVRIAGARIDLETAKVSAPKQTVPASAAFEKILAPHKLRIMIFDEVLFVTPR